MTDTTIAVSSRIRLARNVRGYAFPCVIRGTEKEREVVSILSSVLSKISDFKIYNIKNLSFVERNSLVERYLISKHLSLSEGAAVALSADGLISVMMSEEDHLREQIIVRGFSVRRAYSRISMLDSLVRANVSIAASGNNYYTACPSNMGTGMRASVMLFIPSICYYNQLDEVKIAARERGLTVRGAFGEGSRGESYFYQVSNEFTYNVTESEILGMVESFVGEVIAREERLRSTMFNFDAYAFADKCFRALGTLSSAVRLDYDELSELISQVKLGVGVGIISVDNAYALDDLLVASRKNTLELNVGRGDELRLRAAFVRENLKKISLKPLFF